MSPVAWRPVPLSMPKPLPWPAKSPPTTAESGQPSLPWRAPDRAADSAVGVVQGVVQPGPAASVAARQPRTIRYGDSWAGALPDRLPDPIDWARRIAAAVLETLQGRRPLSQLNRWLDAPTLARLALLVRRPIGTSMLSTVHLSRSTPLAVEAVAVAHGARPPAVLTMAFRLEIFGDRWLCTALELLPGPAVSAAPSGGTDGRPG